jgi:hypothetical protein
MKVSESNRR